jgi:hypothetical protein
MQTFLPYPDFRQSLECLDNKRLGKQRVETMQLINALERGGGAWFNHPACQMWKGHTTGLKMYHDLSIIVWKERGFKNTMKIYYHSESIFKSPGFIKSIKNHTPFWFGDPDFHASHRSNLLRKDPVHYGQFGWTEPDNLPYIWPVRKNEAA